MAKFSNYLENKLLDHVLKNVSYTSPNTVYVGLFTSDPTDTGSGTEVSGGSYARQSIAVTTASGGIVTSSGDVTFPQATAGWGTVTHFAIFDALTSGNMLMHSSVTSSRPVESGDVVKILSGNLTVTLD